MKAVRLRTARTPATFDLVEVEAPRPGPAEVLVRVRACSLNFHDALVQRGVIPCSDGRVPLSDAAGEVVAVGEQVSDFKPGDRVVSTFWPFWTGGDMTRATRRDIPGETIDGFARELACMPAHAFTTAPAHCTDAEAACVPCAGVTAWRGLIVQGGLRAGETVLVQGTGGVSLFALQLARAAGARVLALSSSEEKLESLRRLGAEEVINYRAMPDWPRRARELTDGRGVDHVIEVGGQDTLMQSVAACRIGGHIALIGILTGVTAQLLIPEVFSNQIRISGISIGSRADQEDLVRAMEAAAIRPVIDRSFALGEIDEAFSYSGSRTTIGKVCLDLN